MTIHAGYGLSYRLRRFRQLGHGAAGAIKPNEARAHRRRYRLGAGNHRRRGHLEKRHGPALVSDSVDSDSVSRRVGWGETPLGTDAVSGVAWKRLRSRRAAAVRFHNRAG